MNQSVNKILQRGCQKDKEATRLARYCRPIDPAFIERLEARRPRTMRELSEA